jgi:hypothetical protein
MHTVVHATRASEATRAIPYEGEAIRVPAMHEMLRAARPAPAASTEVPAAGPDQLTTPQCTQGKHDRPLSQLGRASAQGLGFE